MRRRKELIRRHVSRLVGTTAGGALLLAAAPARAAPGPLEDPRAVFLLLLLLPVALSSFAALALVLWILAPAPLSATSRMISRGRARCFLVGLAVAFGCFLFASVLGKQKGVGELLGALSMGLMALGMLTGLTAVTALLGEGAVDLAGRSSSRASAVVLGTFLLGLVALVPFVGWALGLYFLLVGLGGAILALARSSK